MLRFQKLILIVLLFTVSACSQNPIIAPEATAPGPTATFTPYVGGTETALAADLASPTPWVAGTEIALAALSSSPTPPPIPTFTPAVIPPFATFTPYPLPEGTFSPVLYGSDSFLLVGGIKRGDGWISGVQAAQYMFNEMDYDLFNPKESIQMQGSALEFDPTCGNHFMRSSLVIPEPMVGVASGWITEKRRTTDLSTDDAAYIQAVAEWFQSQGNSPKEIHITRILQVDIEGDGVDEVLLSASYFTEKFAFLTETGDYSIVLMRKVIGNNVVTIPLVNDYYVSTDPEFEMSYPNTYTLAEAVDLNGDGTLEVIVDVRRWEGWGAIVYRVDGQNVREVMRAIC